LSALRDHAAAAAAAADAEAEAALRAHLATCPACAGELAARQKALALVDLELGRLVAARPSPRLVARVAAATASEASSQLWSSRALAPRWPWLLAAASAVAMLILAVVVGRGGWHGRSPLVEIAEERSPAPPSEPVTVDATQSGATEGRATGSRATDSRPVAESVPPLTSPRVAAEPAARSHDGSRVASRAISRTQPSAEPPSASADPPQVVAAVLAADVEALERFAEMLQRGLVESSLEPSDLPELLDLSVSLPELPPLAIAEIRLAEVQIPARSFARQTERRTQ
jgi:hypothetical protein